MQPANGCRHVIGGAIKTSLPLADREACSDRAMKFGCSVQIWSTSAGKTPRGVSTKSPPYLEDISRSGMCLQFELPISVGIRVQVQCPGEQMAGTVRYCVYREIGYFVGIELEKLPYGPASISSLSTCSIWRKWSCATLEKREAIFNSGAASGPSRQPFARSAGKLLQAAG